MTKIPLHTNIQSGYEWVHYTLTRNVEEILECQAMCLDNCVIHYASIDITVPEEFTWKSL